MPAHRARRRDRHTATCYLTDDEKATGDSIMPCVSRCRRRPIGVGPVSTAPTRVPPRTSRAFRSPCRATYRYSTNVEPAGSRAGPPRAAGVNAHRRRRALPAELAERDRILAADPTRHPCLPHMDRGRWDAMLTLHAELAAAIPTP